MPNYTAKCNPAPDVLPLETNPKISCSASEQASSTALHFLRTCSTSSSKDVRNCFDIHSGDERLDVVHVNKEVLNNMTITLFTLLRYFVRDFNPSTLREKTLL